MKRFCIIVCLLVLAFCVGAGAETFAFRAEKSPLTITTKAPILHFHSFEMTIDPGASINVIPRQLKAPHYGTLALGPQESPTNINIAVEEKQGQAPVFLIDTYGAGDFTREKPVKLEPFTYKLPGGVSRTEYRGEVPVQVRYGDGVVPLTLLLNWLDPADARRRDGKAPLLYTLMPTRCGTVKLGGETYDALLVDTNAAGDFRQRPDSGILLCLDVNRNGQIDKYGEAFAMSRPFNLRGVTYEVTKSDVSGLSLTIEKSAQTAAEILPPPDLRVGQQILPFTAAALDGKTIHFPADFAGKPVILAFWASWCGDCQEEMPYLLAAYAKFHAQGLQVVGVSLDYPDGKAKLAAYITEHKITWPQIYDGKTWQGDIAKQYAMDWIPTLLLVDGTTGKILADNDTLTGSQIDKTLAAKIGKK